MGFTANAPYSVTFRNAAIPTSPDHSSEAPGPSRAGADRAGYTRVELKKKLAIAWDNGAARSDGMVPFFCKSVTVELSLDPIVVAVSSDYPVDSCPYKVTLKHEIEDHARSYVQIFQSYRDPLVNQLNAIVFPTKDAPRWIRERDIPGVQDMLGQKVKSAIVAISAKIVEDMNKDRQQKDSAAAYAVLYKKCTPEQWAMKKTMRW